MINVGMSTTCVYPKHSEHAFELAQRAGFDGVEVMVNVDPTTQDADALLALSARHRMPILSIHTPVLVRSQLIWGIDPRRKLERSAALARKVGAPTVVVHPPFGWQVRFARDFVPFVREVSARYGVEIAVENMYTWTVAGRPITTYLPDWDPTLIDCDAMTLDFSHAALSGRDSLDLAMAMGSRLRHIHLCDGSGSTAQGKVFDQHLVPGHGTEPVSEVLGLLAARGWSGSVVAEIETHTARSEAQLVEVLGETLDFARSALAAVRRRPTTASTSG